ncbi:phosphatase PAP2 family protein [Bifidobacterium callimiconis]|uniref:phosphatase PAP2 family protein n=1 Tax=Bifidobacterium callimiconis TaxID=2306973 RepID=UPI001BDCB549|nr:phosphatase PAP2 family protein [Bifidobacterium callimiconis]MBT1177619.1 phosphatase PAP2 family protein [Bifidobacterium callimiconis]
MSDKKPSNLYFEPLDPEPVDSSATQPISPQSIPPATSGGTPERSGGLSPLEAAALGLDGEPSGTLASLAQVADDADDDAPRSRRGRSSGKGGRRGNASTPAADPRMPRDRSDDPLTDRPRTSSVILCAVFGIALLAIAAAVYLVGVGTVGGQEYDNLAVDGFADALPGWLNALCAPLAASVTLGPLTVPVMAFADIAFGVVAVIVAVSRKRWRAIVQLVSFAVVAFAAAELLKHLLPRKVYDVSMIKTDGNTAPSGHMTMVVVAALALLCVVPRVWRALVAVIAAAYASLSGMALLVGGWHRPCDVIMATALASGLAFLALAFTRSSGMDEPGTRVSSASIQIVGTVMIVGGIMAVAYGLYVVWQLAPGLQYSAKWASSAAHGSAGVLICASVTLTFGLMLAMRHITAAPLSKIGLVGAPPAPPRKR